MTLATISAIVIGEYCEAVVVFLFSLGSYLTGRTMRKTRTVLYELLEMTPDTATVRRDGMLQKVPTRDVGEDGVVNQVSVTDESAPVHKADGNEVYTGTVDQEGTLEIRMTGTASDTTLECIIRSLEKT